MDERYKTLRAILDRAYDFAAIGKGEERHGKGGLPWTEQRHVTIGREVGPGFAIGQAVKKSLEAGGLERDAAVRELLGAISYLASAVYLLETRDAPKSGELPCTTEITIPSPGWPPIDPFAGASLHNLRGPNGENYDYFK